jgi:hypothetical protein
MAKAQSAAPAVKKPTKAQVAAAAKAKMEETKELHVISDEQRQADEEANKTLKADAMSQFVQQQTTPAAVLQTPPAQVEAFNKELDALKQKFGVTADVVVKPAKAEKKMMNGVVRPADNTVCGKIWATADAISVATHGVCPIAALKEHKDVHGVNDHTVKTQYAKWRKYNGVSGRLPKLHAVHQVQGEYDGMKPIQAPVDLVKKPLVEKAE